MGMQYIYEAGVEDRPMHIQKTNNAGQPLMSALCGIDINFNRTINEPFSLGRGVCRDCEGEIK